MQQILFRQFIGREPAPPAAAHWPQAGAFRRLGLADLAPIGADPAPVEAANGSPAEPEPASPAPPRFDEGELAAACAEAANLARAEALREARAHESARRVELLAALQAGLDQAVRSAEAQRHRLDERLPQLVAAALRALLLGQEPQLRGMAIEALLRQALGQAAPATAIAVSAAPADVALLQPDRIDLAKLVPQPAVMEIMADDRLQVGQVSVVLGQGWLELDLERWIAAVAQSIEAAGAAEHGNELHLGEDDRDGDDSPSREVR